MEPSHATDRERPTATTTLQKLLLVFGSSVGFVSIVFAIAEAGLRLEYAKIENITGVAAWDLAGWQGLSYFWDLYHPRHGWTNLPGYRSDERVPFQVTINSQGLRAERDYPSTPASGVGRIAVFGDSFAFGEEVDDDATIPIFLEQQIAKSEVLNFGVRGFGVGQMALRLEDEGFAFRPDHVIFLVLLPSDIGRDPADHFTHNKPVFLVDEGELRIGNIPVPTLSNQPWLFRHVFVAARLFGRPKQWPVPLGTEGHLEITRAILERALAACRKRDIAFTVVDLVAAATLERLADSEAERQLIGHMRRALAGLRIDVLDLVEFQARIYARYGRELVAAQAHWSAEGNYRIARRIARHLSDGDSGWALVRDPAPTPPWEVEAESESGRR